jgi:hypothetical protein
VIATRVNPRLRACSAPTARGISELNADHQELDIYNMERLMVALASFTVVAPLVVAAPLVSLLVDNKTYATTGTLKIRDILPSISARKGYEFHFGTTYTASDTSDWTKTAFTTTWNHVVAEADCKWRATEPTRGNVTLDKCQSISAWAGARDASFRG